MTDDRAYLEADAADRRAALHDAALIATARAGFTGFEVTDFEWLDLARAGYRFLRSRDSLQPAGVR